LRWIKSPHGFRNEKFFLYTARRTSAPMSEMGQNAKCSERAEDFRFAPQTRTLLNAVGVSQRYDKRLSLNDCCWREAAIHTPTASRGR
jgi:hypothetical protein